MIWNGKADRRHSHDRADQPFALMKGQLEHRWRSQNRLNSEARKMSLTARRLSRLRPPAGKRLFGEPDDQAAAVTKRRVIVPPAGHPMPLPR